MTSYLAIATSLFVLQRYLSAIRLHNRSIQTPSKIQCNVTRPLQCQCYPSIAFGNKDLCKCHSQLIKPCMSLSSQACQWLQLTINPVSFCWTIVTKLGLCSFTWRQTTITWSLLEIWLRGSGGPADPVWAGTLFEFLTLLLAINHYKLIIINEYYNKGTLDQRNARTHISHITYIALPASLKNLVNGNRSSSYICYHFYVYSPFLIIACCIPSQALMLEF